MGLGFRLVWGMWLVVGTRMSSYHREGTQAHGRAQRPGWRTPVWPGSGLARRVRAARQTPSALSVRSSRSGHSSPVSSVRRSSRGHQHARLPRLPVRCRQLPNASTCTWPPHVGGRGAARGAALMVGHVALWVLVRARRTRVHRAVSCTGRRSGTGLEASLLPLTESRGS